MRKCVDRLFLFDGICRRVPGLELKMHKFMNQTFLNFFVLVQHES